MPFQKYYFLNNLNLGLLLINGNGEVLFYNNWLKDRMRKGTFLIGEELFYDKKKCFRLAQSIDVANRNGISSFLSHRLNEEPFNLYLGSKKLNFHLCVSRFSNLNQGENASSAVLIQFLDAADAVNSEKYLDVREIEQLRQAEKEKHDDYVKLTSQLAQELKNPISILETSSKLLKSMLQKDGMWNDDYSESLRDSFHSIERIQNLMKSAIDLSYVAKEGDFKVAKIKSILDQVKDDFENRCRERNVTFIYDKYESTFDSKVLMNPSLLKHLFENLLENSLDFIKEDQLDKWIKIEGELSGNLLLIKVSDSGTGIGRDMKDSIFKAFYSSKKLRGESSGLGLTKSLKIAEAHKGSLIYDENCSNTCFILSLPLCYS